MYNIIYLVKDNDKTICAADSMNEAIKQAIRYLVSGELLVERFSYKETVTDIEYSNTFRIGAEIMTETGIISIEPLTLHKSE